MTDFKKGPAFTLRIVTIDYYMAKPDDNLDVTTTHLGKRIKSVPIFRIYGTTPVGQKACVHLHSCFPYLYVPWRGTEIDEYEIKNLTLEIDLAINTSLGRSNSDDCHVFRIIPVEAYSVYGYHEEEETFAQIFLLNPRMIKRLTELLENETILGRMFQPYESHIPYHLQFLIDFNLQGMNFLNLGHTLFRMKCYDSRAVQDLHEIDEHHKESNLNICMNYWNEMYVPEALVCGIPRMTVCELECDAVAADILNRCDVIGQTASNPGLRVLWEEESIRYSDIQFGHDLTMLGNDDRPQTNIAEPFDLHETWLRMTEENISPSLLDIEESQASNETVSVGDLLELTGIELLSEDKALKLEEQDSILADLTQVAVSNDVDDADADADDEEDGMDLTVHNLEELSSSESGKSFLTQYPSRVRQQNYQKLMQTLLPDDDVNRMLADDDETGDAIVEANIVQLDGPLDSKRSNKKRLTDSSEQGHDVKRLLIGSADESCLRTSQGYPHTGFSRASPQPGPSRASPQPGPSRASPQPGPSRASPQPGPSRASPQPGPSRASTQPDPSRASPQPSSMGKYLADVPGSISPRKRFLNFDSNSYDVATVLVSSFRPPSVAEVMQELNFNAQAQENAIPTLTTQLTNNSFAYKTSQTNDLSGYQYVTIMSLELFIATRGTLQPDPEYDQILGAFYCIHNDVPVEEGEQQTSGALFVQEADWRKVRGLDNTLAVKDEARLIDELIDILRRHDPEILTGYEIEMLSWGYLIERGMQLNMSIQSLLGRVLEKDKEVSVNNRAQKMHFGSGPKQGGRGEEIPLPSNGKDIKISGRILLNLWRIMRHELTLLYYSLEHVCWNVLKKRVACLPCYQLTRWWNQQRHYQRVANYFIFRAQTNIELIETLNIVGRTSEFARIFGIEFYHVLSRGSQYRVESMMIRLTKQMNMLCVSPNVRQRASMRAPPCIPLTLEPDSGMYTDPVVVVDFQSLYPSIMIAYNYCFSTCLGHMDSISLDEPYSFGCCSMKVSKSTLQRVGSNVNICPNNVVFVTPAVRKGILPQMLEEILATRLMVKKSLKLQKGNRRIERLLDSRQLGLKLIANVTYGYTAANFSGRMPSEEVGDSVVRKARETLERAIKLVEETDKWKARVVYGDTDSMFILLKERTKDEAFRIGYEIAQAVTDSNPAPIKLKFEKVYLPCVLQTKKRYFGYMYETPEQITPTFDAKGIETVRRDGCLAASKILKESIKILFDSGSVEPVRQYVTSKLSKIMKHQHKIEEFIFAREYRGMLGYKPSARVPAQRIIERRLRADPRADARVGERVPYIIVSGRPGQPIIELARSPSEFLSDKNERVNVLYYVLKQVLPPLSRIFSLLNIDVFNWFSKMHRSSQTPPAILSLAGNQLRNEGAIWKYMTSGECIACRAVLEKSQKIICRRCLHNKARTSIILERKSKQIGSTKFKLSRICATCVKCSLPDVADIECVAFECSVLYKKSLANHLHTAVPVINEMCSALRALV